MNNMLIIIKTYQIACELSVKWQSKPIQAVVELTINSSTCLRIISKSAHQATTKMIRMQTQSSIHLWIISQSCHQATPTTD